MNHFQVVVSYQDNEKIPEDTLATSQLRIQVTLYSDSGGEKILPEIMAGSNDNSEKLRYNNPAYQNEDISFNSLQNDYFLEEGILSVKFDTGSDVNKIIIKAVFTCCNEVQIESTLEAVQHYSENKKYIGVFTSTTDAVVGEYGVFHIKSNFILESFQYLVSEFLIVKSFYFSFYLFYIILIVFIFVVYLLLFCNIYSDFINFIIQLKIKIMIKSVSNGSIWVVVLF